MDAHQPEWKERQYGVMLVSAFLDYIPTRYGYCESTLIILNFKSGQTPFNEILVKKTEDKINEIASSHPMHIILVSGIPGHSVLTTQNPRSQMDKFLEVCRMPTNALHIPGLVYRYENTGKKAGNSQRNMNIETEKLSMRVSRYIPTIVVLVDDVVTTGTTLRAAQELCEEAGAQKVYCLAFARTVNL